MALDEWLKLISVKHLKSVRKTIDLYYLYDTMIFKSKLNWRKTMETFFIYINTISYLIVLLLFIGILLIPNRTKSVLLYLLLIIIIIIIGSHFFNNTNTGNTYFYDFCDYIIESLKNDE
jgi:hypothetical protein